MRGYEGEELVSRKSAKHALGRVEGSTKEQIAPKKLPVLGVLAWRMMTGESVFDLRNLRRFRMQATCATNASLPANGLHDFRFPATLYFRKKSNLLTHNVVQPLCPSGRIVKNVMLGSLCQTPIPQSL